MKSELLKARPGAWGLFGKYVVSFVGLVIFVLAVNGALEMYITFRDATNTLSTQQTQRAELLAQRIDQAVSEIERQISWATRASSGTLEQHRSDYVLILQQVPAIDGARPPGWRRAGAAARDAAAGDDRAAATIRATRASPRRSSRGVWFSPVYFRGDSEPFMTIAMAHSGPQRRRHRRGGQPDLPGRPDHADRRSARPAMPMWSDRPAACWRIRRRSRTSRGTDYSQAAAGRRRCGRGGQPAAIGRDRDGPARAHGVRAGAAHGLVRLRRAAAVAGAGAGAMTSCSASAGSW